LDDVFHQVADQVYALYGLAPPFVIQALKRREAIGSTYLTDGFAIPHAQLNMIKHATYFFIRLADSFHFPCDQTQASLRLLIIFFAPNRATEDHLSDLCYLAQSLSDHHLRAALLAAPDKTTILGLLQHWAMPI
jgi:mannitol/fructose-specific phosphotransferase system IIA component (Ntr-type)